MLPFSRSKKWADTVRQTESSVSEAPTARMALTLGIEDFSGGVHENQSQLAALQTTLQSTHLQTQIVPWVESLGEARTAGSLAADNVSSADFLPCAGEQPLPNFIHPRAQDLGRLGSRPTQRLVLQHPHRWTPLW